MPVISWPSRVAKAYQLSCSHLLPSMLAPPSILSSHNVLIGTKYSLSVRKILTPRPSLASYHNRTQLRTGTLQCSPRPLGYIPIKSPHLALGTPCPCASPSHTTPKSHIFTYHSINAHPPVTPIPFPQDILNGAVNCSPPLLPLRRFPLGVIASSYSPKTQKLPNSPSRMRLML